MTTYTPTTGTLTERYIHATTRALPEEQRDDVGNELRASIADRVDSLRAEQPDLSGQEAEYAALAELGDPDTLAADYTGRKLQLIGPVLYPSYTRVLKAVIVTVVPIVVVVVSLIEAATGGSAGSIIGQAAWMAFTLFIQIAFWVTLTFAIVERTSTPAQMEESLGVEWSPDKLPEVPRGPRGSLADLVAALAWLGFIGVAIIWQHFRSPIGGEGDNPPLLNPELWSNWLPLILVLLVAEMVFEVVKYRIGRWSTRLAGVNTLVGAAFTAPIVYLAATDRLLNPAAVAEIQTGWPGFDPSATNTIIIVSAVLIWAWDSIDGYRRAWAE